MPKLEEVFCLSGTPTYTFVEPVRYDAVKVSVRTPGRCLMVEGPSGIGKTTTLNRVFGDVGQSGSLLALSARKQADLELIQALPEIDDIGTVLVDDFHRLPDDTKERLADFMKLLADSGTDRAKLIVIGINNAGTQLVRFAHDLGLRVDVFRLEANPNEKIEELISKGESALNITIMAKSEVAQRSLGSFHIAQVLCHHLCLEAGVLETSPVHQSIEMSAEVVIERVMADLARQYQDACLTFARGSRIRREGRAPYLHILRWLSDGSDWSLDLGKELKTHPEHVGSVGQVLDKGFLKQLLTDKAEQLGKHFYYEPNTRTLSVEDPKLAFYLRNLVWRSFTKQAGFTSDQFAGAYDFALSFAGENRDVAKAIFDALTEREIPVFYDENEQHRILARNIEDYLAPIYRSEARYVLPILSANYPKKIWTKFESDAFKTRFGQGAVIPIKFTSCVEGFFSDESKYGALSFDPNGDLSGQVDEIAGMLARRLLEDKTAGEA